MSDEDEQVPSELPIYYEKSTSFRVMHLSGAFGGSDPNGKVQVVLYNERFPIPKEMARTIKPPFTERLVKTKAGIVREVEASVVMDPAVAIDLGEFLIRQGKQTIARLQRATNAAALLQKKIEEDLGESVDGTDLSQQVEKWLKRQSESLERAEEG